MTRNQRAHRLLAVLDNLMGEERLRPEEMAAERAATLDLLRRLEKRRQLDLADWREQFNREAKP